MTTDDSRPERRGAAYVYDALVEAGVDLLVGLPGTQTLPLDRTVAQRDEIRYVMARHETAIPHVAWGYHESGGGIAATLTVPGPGETNAAHGLKNAFDDCVPMIHLTADVNPDERGRSPIHEIDPSTYDHVVKENVVIDRPIELRAGLERAIGAALTPPCGPVRVGIPSGLLDSAVRAQPVSVDVESVAFDNEVEYEAAIELLATAERPLVYVGGGAARSPGADEPIRTLVKELDAPTLTTYKGKGVVPESDDRWLGVSASHLPAGGKRALAAADVVVAFGTDFDLIMTAGSTIPFGDRLIHVTLDPDHVDTREPADVAILDDAASAAERLLSGVRAHKDGNGTDGGGWSGPEVARTVRAEYDDRLREQSLLDDEPPLPSAFALRVLREAIPSEAFVAADVGAFRLWAAQNFPADDHARYVTAGSWAGMGVGLPAAIGAKLADPERPSVAIVGDGCLMMSLQELHTAAQEGLDVVTIVCNDSDYGAISKSPKIAEYGDGARFSWTTPDFPTIAEGFGCRAVRVETPDEIRTAVAEAIEREDGPELIDVRIDPDEPTPAAAADYESELTF